MQSQPSTSILPKKPAEIKPITDRDLLPIEALTDQKHLA
ncbi:hypothetical protein PMIT1306_00519 [Prochlorococcus sp. MIT 1306]|nr:hypothetical protein PMIT1306_00519 [Prochlorococcus sp. MIT 1306]